MHSQERPFLISFIINFTCVAFIMNKVLKYILTKGKTFSSLFYFWNLCSNEIWNFAMVMLNNTDFRIENPCPTRLASRQLKKCYQDLKLKENLLVYLRSILIHLHHSLFLCNFCLYSSISDNCTSALHRHKHALFD